MSEASLHLETFSPPSIKLSSPLKSMSPRTISNLTASSSPSKSASTCSDRSIPCRSSSRLHTFGLIEKASQVKEGGGGGASEAYSRWLKSELFGTDFGSSDFSAGGVKGGSPTMSPSKIMLSFKNKQHSGPNSLLLPSILGQDSGFSGEASTRPSHRGRCPKPTLEPDRGVGVLSSTQFN